MLNIAVNIFIFALSQLTHSHTPIAENINGTWIMNWNHEHSPSTSDIIY